MIVLVNLIRYLEEPLATSAMFRVVAAKNRQNSLKITG